jgi:hypothetical protein
MPRPHAPSLRCRPIESGPFITHSQVKALSAFNRSLSYEQIDQACERVERVLMRGIPGDVRLEQLSLGVA